MRRLEVRLPEDHPIWKISKGERSKIVDEALRRYLGQPSNTDIASSIKETGEMLREVLLELRNSSTKRYVFSAGQVEER